MTAERYHNLNKRSVYPVTFRWMSVTSMGLLIYNPSDGWLYNSNEPVHHGDSRRNQYHCKKEFKYTWGNMPYFYIVYDIINTNKFLNNFN